MPFPQPTTIPVTGNLPWLQMTTFGCGLVKCLRRLNGFAALSLEKGRTSDRIMGQTSDRHVSR
jgi:hypothetical protein